MTRWQTVPVQPDKHMVRAFAVEIRRQAARLTPDSTAHEPLGPLWDAVLAAAPDALPPLMPGTAAEGWNAALERVAVLATASADVLRGRLTERPTRFSYAIEALDALAEAVAALKLPHPPEEPETAAVAIPKPMAPSGSISASPNIPTTPRAANGVSDHHHRGEN